MLEDNDHGSNLSWDIGVDEDGGQIGLKPEGTLIGGATGSGKSHALWQLIARVSRLGASARVLLVSDVAPPEIARLVSYRSTEGDAAIGVLRWVQTEITRRESALSDMHENRIAEFTSDMPLVMVAIDELANDTAQRRPSAEAFRNELAVVAAQSYKHGIFLVVSTQRSDHAYLPKAVRAQLTARLSFRHERAGIEATFAPTEDLPETDGFAPGAGLVSRAGRVHRFVADPYDAIAAGQLAPLPRIDITGLA